MSTPASTTPVSATPPAASVPQAPTPPVPPPPPPASQMSVRVLWSALTALASGCTLYATLEHPVLIAPLASVASLLAAGAALTVITFRR